ncbi:LLM class flavin-dependent oxidoreductase [Roseomonas sp. 18066]|uniref:LLM class flavin-dependent oxidoreductase n=1 Tax=Roseomonas sp. 18066 TaxID=2681412 RepID=UPI00135B8391|nr:LLM class flavin-dependent oxidoreductase [Roseomonas sp. 18066]
MPDTLPADWTASPASFADSPLSQALRQPLLLGLFLPLQQGGWSPSSHPRGTDWRFDYNARLAQQAEALGFDLAFGLAKWLGKGGYGGATQYHGLTLDPFIVTTALAAVTRRILLISTIHVLYGPWHPLHLTKFGATLDHIAQGRWGINVVTGHRESEHRRFGKAPIPHGLRYEMADEFLRIAKQLWAASEEVSIAGRFWNLEAAYEALKPCYGRPVIVSASGSQAGIDFAARHSDILFTTSPGGAALDAAVETLPALVDSIRRASFAAGRPPLRSLVNPLIICRPTEREALQYRDAIIAAADHEAIANFSGDRSDAQGFRGFQADQRALGANTIHIVGSPEQVTDQLARLKRTGIDGVQIAFFDFEPDLAFFGSDVLPLLKQAGLRL